MSKFMAGVVKVLVLLYLLGVVYVELIVRDPNSKALNALTIPAYILVVIIFSLIYYILVSQLYRRFFKHKAILPFAFRDFADLPNKDFRSNFFQTFYTVVLVFFFLALNYTIIMILIAVLQMKR